jgi:hypothetical protein
MRTGLIAAAIGLTALTQVSHAADEQPRRAALEARLSRLEAINAIERLQNSFGYYQDRFLFDQSVALFTQRGAEVHDDGALWRGARGLERWKASLRKHFSSVGGPVAGVMLDRPQVQGVIDVAPDGHTAKGRFRALGRSAVYGASEDWIGGVYENDYVLEGGVWKIKIYRYCTTWTAPYQSGLLKAVTLLADVRVRSPNGPDRLESRACVGDELSRTLPAHFESEERGEPGVVPPEATGTASSLPELGRRAQRLSDIDQIERLHYIYGYQQDKMLWSEQVDLFAEHDASAIFQNAQYRDKTGVRRLWYGHWSRLTQGTLMQIDGVLNDHFQAQPVISVSSDGLTAHGRFRARDYVFNYAAPILSGQSSGLGLGDQFVSGQQVRQAGLLALLQDVLYENTFVKEDGVWKIKTFNLCIYASAPYERGYSDRPIPGQMGASADAKSGDRRKLDLEEGLPEGASDLFPANPTGPDAVLSAAQSGCFIAKDQVMSRAAVFPFHYANPVTGDTVSWRNQ